MSQTSDVMSWGPLPVVLPPVTPLNVPRRRTLCTATVHEEPAFNAVHTRAASSSWITRPSITIDVSSETRRKIRPLPIPPTPTSAPPMPRHRVSQSSLRPLPCVPESAAGVSVSVTPASPLDPRTPVFQSITHLSAPSTIPLPHRFASLSLRLDTSPDAVRPRAADPTPLSSPTRPTPEPASPITAQRKRMSKLRRHLGESVQLELFPEVKDGDDVFREAYISSQTVVAVKKLLDLDGDDSDTSSEDDSDDDGYALVFAHGHTRRVIPVKRHSRKWVREKGGDRWVEENYSNILRDLRAL
ncbi:hypothetical protein DFH08DRAFT_876593 [Mycena albidolilacea]|uniref:Uncharacterized protein n=1 Tax=Mycena albidolilacea TaxID=1033008 RepID=A0AAD6ZTZ8_9AGAR|nr:hypothetical protein DFH08DRAFT_876593 [Mycena albidolilacea]